MNKSSNAILQLSLGLMLCMTAAPGFAGDLVRNKLGMAFVPIKAGSFYMGSSDAEVRQALQEMAKPNNNAFADEQPGHRVEISQGFLLGQTEVTQGQWLAVMENRPGPEEFWQPKAWRDMPVVGVSWYMAQRFTEELSKMDSAYDYRLPTEAEWEYAVRAGTTGLRPMPVAALGDHAWYIKNSGDYPHVVASLQANYFGLYDMLGNAWEWVADWYAADSYGDGSLQRDPRGPATGSARVRRGGSYHCPLYQTRPGYRAANTPDTRYSVIGFRVVAVPLKQP